VMVMPEFQLKKGLILIGIDIGYGEVKVASRDRSFNFASIVEREAEEDSTFIRQDEDACGIVILNDIRYKVGRGAFSATNPIQEKTRGWIGTPAYSALFLHAVIRATKGKLMPLLLRELIRNEFPEGKSSPNPQYSNVNGYLKNMMQYLDRVSE